MTAAALVAVSPRASGCYLGRNEKHKGLRVAPMNLWEDFSWLSLDNGPDATQG
jgi:hypothetical protein